MEIRAASVRDRWTIEPSQRTDGLVLPPASTGTALARVPVVSTGTPGVFPDAATTGYAGPLTAASTSTVTVAGTVIENRHLTGPGMVIQAANVTIRNCRLQTSGYYGIRVQSGSLLLVDCELEGAATGTACVLVEGGKIDILRCNIWGSEDGTRIGNNSTVRDSFIHTLRGDAGSHYDAMNADGVTGWEITGNTILNSHEQTACVWIGDPRYGPSEGLLQGNFIAGGGYSIYAGHSTGAGLRVIDNVFSTMYWPNSGSLNVCAAWDPAGNTWSNNRWADGPQAGQLVTA